MLRITNKHKNKKTTQRQVRAKNNQTHIDLDDNLRKANVWIYSLLFYQLVVLMFSNLKF